MSPEQADHIKNMRYEIGGDAGSNLKNRLQSHRKTFRSGRKFAPDEPMFQLTSRPSNPGEFCVHPVGIWAPHLMFRDVDRMPCPFCPGGRTFAPMRFISKIANSRRHPGA